MRVQTEPRHRIDWVHVQRDYATGRFRAAGSLDQAEAARLAALLRELVKLHNRVSSMQKLADAMARVQTLERRALGIGDDDAGSNPLDTMNEGELQAEVDRLTQQMRERS